MLSKIQSLVFLDTKKLNHHLWYTAAQFESFMYTIRALGNFCTIRTDHPTKENDLPFFIVDHESEERLMEIWKIIDDGNYVPIISNGIKFDKDQLYNMCIKIESDGSFLFEASILKIPLRHMYRYPDDLLSAYGNISDKPNQWTFINNTYGIDRFQLKKILEKIYTLGIYNKYIECTVYPYSVGVFDDNIVYWEIK